jgi:AcrR family transcriptional regulator
MKQVAEAETGWRGSHDVWLSAAYETLIESGIDAVRILPLAKRINLSRTSFYWFFKDREALLDALLQLWREKNTGNLLKRAAAYAESLAEAVLNVFDCWLDPDLFDSRFEFAVRSWGLQSPDVHVEIARADKVRLEALAAMFARHGFEPLGADVRARTVYLTQIGYISMKSEESFAERMRRIAEYVAIFTGTMPTRSELERFFARQRPQGDRAADLPDLGAQPR